MSTDTFTFITLARGRRKAFLVFPLSPDPFKSGHAGAYLRWFFSNFVKVGQGHLSLLRQSVEACPVVMASLWLLTPVSSGLWMPHVRKAEAAFA